MVKIGPGYCQTGVIEGTIFFNLILSTLTYILIKIYDNWSWMDRFWALMPIAFTFNFLFYPYHCYGETIPARRIMMTVLIVLWGLRLAHTLWRKGVYSPGNEDFRLTRIKQESGCLKRELVVILFVCLYQPMLSMLMTSAVFQTTSSPLKFYDIILCVIAIGFLILQGVADNQQYDFQCEKKLYQRSEQEIVPEHINRGFVSQGLWGYSRHPNYLGQMGFWWVIFLFSAFDSGFSVVILGVLQYTIFFQIAIKSTQTALQRKYTLYQLYKAHVPQLLLLPNGFEEAVHNNT